MTRILVTGAGGAAAVSLLQQLRGDASLELYAGDIDPLAAGLYLVPEQRRFLLPRGDDPSFAQVLRALCVAQRIDVLIPTVDSELLPVAEERSSFEDAGCRVLLAPLRALATCLDKLALMDQVGEPIAPRSAAYDREFDARDWRFPLILKPRQGAGGRGVRTIRNAEEILRIARDPALMVQELLPGDEYSVDVLCGLDGSLRAAVPRARLKVDSGVAVAGKTVHDLELEESAAIVARRVGITGVANVQLKRDHLGRPRLMEVNARFPGTMPLTVAAGVDMPRLAIAELLGWSVPEGRLPFREVAIVRTWQEHILEPDVFGLVQGTLAHG